MRTGVTTWPPARSHSCLSLRLGILIKFTLLTSVEPVADIARQEKHDVHAETVESLFYAPLHYGQKDSIQGLQRFPSVIGSVQQHSNSCPRSCTRTIAYIHVISPRQ